MNFNKKLAVAVSGAVLLMAGQVALADSTTDIVDALVMKGVLTEEEGRLITKGHTSKTSVSPVVKEKDGAFKLESANGRNSIQLTGRAQFDARNISSPDDVNNSITNADRDSATLADNFELRRARIGVKGTFAKHYDYEISTNLVGSSSNLVDIAYLNTGLISTEKSKPLQFRAGIYKQPFNLEDYGTSSNNIDFMERSYVNQLNPGKKSGFMLHGVSENGMTYAGSVYQHNTFGETDMESTGKGLAGRTSMNLSQIMGSKETVFHLGIAGFDSEYGVIPTGSGAGHIAGAATSGTVFSFRSEGRGLSNIYRAQIGGDPTGGAGAGLPSNRAAKINNKAYGLELAAAYGPFKIQGEYTGQSFNASHDSTASVNAAVTAGYVEALWLLTGEKYADWYKNGAWGGIKPAKDFDGEKLSGLGAWEIGARYDAFDVQGMSLSGNGSRIGGSVAAGTQNAAAGNLTGGASTYTAGIKWQLNSNMRVLANYSQTKFDHAFAPVDLNALSTINKENIFMLRSQFAF